MKIIHRDPELHAQRVAAIKKAKGTAAARKHTSETLKIFFSDPENRRKRSISMKGVRFFCKNCGIEGHRSNYCPDSQENTDRSFKCGLCGEKGHNKRTCGKPRIIKVKKRILGKYHCRACGKVGHNRRTCSLKTELLSHRHSNAHVRRGYLEDLKVHVPKHHHHCSICGKVGHNRSTCSLKTVLESDSTSTTPENRRYVENSNEDSHDASKRDDGGSLEDPEVEYRGSLGDSKGVDKSFLEDSNKISHKHYYHCSLCGGVGHSCRTSPLKMELESDITASGATGSLEDPKQDYGGSLGKGVYTESNVITIKHHCSLCGKVGHNRRTCSLSESGSLGHKGSLKNSKEFLQNHYHHCSICRKSGHNRRTCSESPSEDIEVTSRSYHCRICGVTGHNRRSCVKLSIRED